jgi:glycine/D-amino acid oxidase-like deaminating enzyme
MKKVGIIGGGIIGTSLPYHLSKMSDKVEVLVFEKDQIGSGTTAKSAGTLCLIDDSLPEDLFKQRVTCVNTYKELDKKTGGKGEFRQTGTLVAAPNVKEMNRLRKHVEMTKAFGFFADFFDNSRNLVNHLPDLEENELLGGAWTPDDGYNNPTAASIIYSNWAKENGAKISTFTEVKDVTKKNGEISAIETTKGTFEVDYVINAAGPWARDIGEMVGLDTPIFHTKAEVFILQTKDPLGYNFPILKFPTWYARAEGDAVFLCKSHMAMDKAKSIESGVWDPDELPLTGGTEEYFFDFITDQLAVYIPRLLDAELVNDWVGYRSVTDDKLPIIGETDVHGYMVATGMSGNGVILAPDTARILTNLILNDEGDPLLERFRPDRF